MCFLSNDNKARINSYSTRSIIRFQSSIRTQFPLKFCTCICRLFRYLNQYPNLRSFGTAKILNFYGDTRPISRTYKLINNYIGLFLFESSFKKCLATLLLKSITTVIILVNILFYFILIKCFLHFQYYLTYHQLSE